MEEHGGIMKQSLTNTAHSIRLEIKLAIRRNHYRTITLFGCLFRRHQVGTSVTIVIKAEGEQRDSA